MDHLDELPLDSLLKIMSFSLAFGDEDINRQDDAIVVAVQAARRHATTATAVFFGYKLGEYVVYPLVN